jgi:hypothetical protein
VLHRDGTKFPDPTMVTGVGGRSSRWNLGKPFPTLGGAVDAALGWRQTHDVSLQVTETEPGDDARYGSVVWTSWTDERSKTVGLAVPTSDVRLPQPINVKTSEVVSKLQANLDEEKQKREVIEAREKEARLGIRQFVTDREDEIVEWFGRFFDGSWSHVQEKLDEMFKDEAYVPKGLRPTEKENDLEKLVRVLAMATDETIEVHPDTPIYRLL